MDVLAINAVRRVQKDLKAPQFAMDAQMKRQVDALGQFVSNASEETIAWHVKRKLATPNHPAALVHLLPLAYGAHGEDVIYGLQAIPHTITARELGAIAITHEKREHVASALYILRNLPAHVVAPHLEHLSRHLRIEHLPNFALHLGEVPHAVALDVLTRLLHHASPLVRETAATGLYNQWRWQKTTPQPPFSQDARFNRLALVCPYLSTTKSKIINEPTPVLTAALQAALSNRLTPVQQSAKYWKLYVSQLRDAHTSTRAK